MTYALTTQSMFDFEPLPLDAITLSPDQMQEAAQLSRSGQTAQQWQMYLNALALIGFEEWLHSRAANLRISRDRCSLFQPRFAHLIEAACNLYVGELRLCLIATGSFKDTVISVPRAAIDLPQFIPHFYVVLEVQEELGQVRVDRYLRYDQLQTASLQPQADWTYSLPIDWFDPEPDRLLLHLECLEPQSIALPAVAQLPHTTPMQTPPLPSDSAPQPLRDRPPWQVLTWEQAAVILTQPELANAATAAPNLLDRAVNVGAWLQGQLDDLAQLSWVLLPPIAPAVGMRSTVADFENVVTELQRNNVAIPFTARAAFRDLNWANVAVRLYAVAWELPVTAANPEWSLLLILGPQSGRLPSGIRLQIQEQIRGNREVLTEQVLLPNSQDDYLYARVIGTWNETFWVTIDLGNGAVVTLPPFTFNPVPA